MKNNQPKVSVIMPTWNRAYIIKKSIESVIGQTLTDWELIIVDDASTDNTEQVVKAIGDERIRYYRNEFNLGPAESRNIAVSHSRGQYITFLDSDNIYDLCKLEDQVTILDNHDYDLIFCGVKVISENYETLVPAYAVDDRQIADILREKNIIDTNAVMVKRDAFIESKGFDSKMQALEDWELFFRMILVQKCKVHFEPVYRVENIRQENSISVNYKKQLYAKMYLSQKYKGIIDHKIVTSALVSAKKAMDEAEFSDIEAFARENHLEKELDAATNNYMREAIIEKYLQVRPGFHDGNPLSRHLEGRSVAVYGLGKWGSFLINELKDSCVNVEYGVDRLCREFEGLPVYELTDKLPLVDYFVVAVVNDAESIVDNVKKVYSGNVITIDQLMEQSLKVMNIEY